jgi:hypothetical protein
MTVIDLQSHVGQTEITPLEFTAHFEACCHTRMGDATTCACRNDKDSITVGS